MQPWQVSGREPLWKAANPPPPRPSSRSVCCDIFKAVMALFVCAGVIALLSLIGNAHPASTHYTPLTPVSARGPILL